MTMSAACIAAPRSVTAFPMKASSFAGSNAGAAVAVAIQTSLLIGARGEADPIPQKMPMSKGSFPDRRPSAELLARCARGGMGYRICAQEPLIAGQLA